MLTKKSCDEEKTNKKKGTICVKKKGNANIKNRKIKQKRNYSKKTHTYKINKGVYKMNAIQETSLKFSESPLCPIAADVISDQESIYFYMYDLDFENERLIARSACWVINLINAPEAFDKNKIEEDRQPMLPALFVDDTMNKEPYKEEDLEIVWSKEGHIAGLYHKGELVSVIPSWADGHTFPGYARYTKENNMVAWKLADAAAIIPRIEEGKIFWEQEFNIVWKEYNTPYFSQLTELFGPAVNCYDLHKDVFPSRLLVTFEKEDMIYAFTVGVGMFSMPNADRYFDEYEARAKTEFAICYRKDEVMKEEEMDVYASLAGLCNLAWHTIDCIASGHTLDMKFKHANNCIILDDDEMAEPLPLDIKKQGIHISWIVPLDEQDYENIKDTEKKKEIIKKLSISYK